jgi:hypothetical protein
MVSRDVLEKGINTRILAALIKNSFPTPIILYVAEIPALGSKVSYFHIFSSSEIKEIQLIKTFGIYFDICPSQCSVSFDVVRKADGLML